MERMSEKDRVKRDSKGWNGIPICEMAETVGAGGMERGIHSSILSVSSLGFS